METFLILIAILLGFTVLVVLQFRAAKKTSDPETARSVVELKEWMRETRETIQQTRRETQDNLVKNTQNLEQKLADTHRTLNDRLDKAGQYIMGVQKEISRVTAISAAVQEIQGLLYAPKVRGTMGEEILENLLKERLPRNNFSMQYSFQSGETVDAVVKLGEGLIPIDSKFPMENFRALQATENAAQREQLRKEFRRDVKKHIDAIAKKYILSAEGTLDFAMMYVPSEAVFYEILDAPEITDHAREKKVHLVSPNSFYMYLGAILQGLRGQQVNEQAKEILASLSAIRQESIKFGDVLGILTTHVTNAKTASEKANSRYQQLAGKIEDVARLKGGEESEQLANSISTEATG